MSLPSPSLLLGVPGYPSWYPGQESAFSKALDWYHSPVRFLGMSLPTGSGKSCVSMLLATLSGARTCILTATKGLQEQLSTDFSQLAVLVKGQNNFTCSLVPSLRADEGPCHEGLSCSFARSRGCPYRVQLQQALDSQIVITNYAYYLAQTGYSSGLGSFGLLIADESHQAFSALENHLTVYLDKMGLESCGIHLPSLPTGEILATVAPKPLKKGLLPKKMASTSSPEAEQPPAPNLWAQWQSWASSAAPSAQNYAEELGQEIRELREGGSPVSSALSRSYRSAKSVAAKLESLSIGQGDWVIQRAHYGVVFTPRWVSGSGHVLFQSVPKIALMSAILSHKTADSIGVPAGEQRLWLEVGSYFPAKNTQIWHIPTARINFRTDDYGTILWQSRIDQIIQRRLDRKGIVFTVSYERARLLLSRSRFKGIMLTHSTGDVFQVVERFKKMPPPAVLVSPTVTTGWDFPMATSGFGKPQYGIVGKVPWPDTQDVVLRSRSQDDGDWPAYLAMSTIIQFAGRLGRTASDLSEILIVDDNWVWVWNKYKSFAPLYFRERVRGSLPCVPDPLFL